MRKAGRLRHFTSSGPIAYSLSFFVDPLVSVDNLWGAARRIEGAQRLGPWPHSINFTRDPDVWADNTLASRLYKTNAWGKLGRACDVISPYYTSKEAVTYASVTPTRVILQFATLHRPCRTIYHPCCQIGGGEGKRRGRGCRPLCSNCGCDRLTLAVKLG